MATKDGTTPSRTALPILGQPPSERADAARNRHILLSAAQKIVAERGIDALSMDVVAAEAGVGVGTVYRRFGDRTGLAYALLDDAERQFQTAFLAGPPPLGPGAPAAQRIRAFMHAYLDRLELQGGLLAHAEGSSPTARFHSGAYHTHRMHLAALLIEFRPDADADYLSEALLALLGAQFFLHQRHELGFSIVRIKAGLDQLLTSLKSG